MFMRVDAAIQTLNNVIMLISRYENVSDVFLDQLRTKWWLPRGAAMTLAVQLPTFHLESRGKLLLGPSRLPLDPLLW